MRYSFFALMLLIYACQTSGEPSSSGEGNKMTEVDKITATDTIITAEYELYLPHRQAAATLVLFPGFPQTAEQVRKAFNILKPAGKNDIAVILLNFNRRLWLEAVEKDSLTSLLEATMKKHEQLNNSPLFIGGYSSGGNMALLLANHLAKQLNKSINPSGVFIIDSPVDLSALYKISEKNIAQATTPNPNSESNMLVKLFNDELGPLAQNKVVYANASVYTRTTNNISNLNALQQTNIRLYTEPDTTWWRINRQNSYEDMNAYGIKSLADDLRKQGFEKVEYVATENKGYRADGRRHPHSWSIAEPDELIRWILAESE